MTTTTTQKTRRRRRRQVEGAKGNGMSGAWRKTRPYCVKIKPQLYVPS